MLNKNTREERRGLFLRILLNRAHGSVTEPLLAPLPAKDKEAVLAQSLNQTDPLPLLYQEETAISKMHYSWLYFYMKELDLAKKKALISCLDNFQKMGISRLMKIAPPPSLSSPLLRKFYLRHLYPLVQIEARLPIEYLPDSPFKHLLQVSKRELVDILDLLGIYDLAHEMRQIVATKNMKNLYACLSIKQQQFLRICLHQKDKIVTPSLHLEKWNGDCEKLMQLLHQRGIARLGFALSGQHPDLIWYITHMFDTGRGKLLKKHIRSESQPTLTENLTLQVECARDFLKKQSN